MYVCMYVSIYLSMYLSIYLCIYLSIYLSIYLYICISPPFFAGGNNFQSQLLKRGDQKKMTVWGDLKSFCHVDYLPVGLAIFLVKKETFKDKI